MAILYTRVCVCVLCVLKSRKKKVTHTLILTESIPSVFNDVFDVHEHYRFFSWMSSSSSSSLFLFFFVFYLKWHQWPCRSIWSMKQSKNKDDISINNQNMSIVVVGRFINSGIKWYNWDSWRQATNLLQDVCVFFFYQNHFRYQNYKLPCIIYPSITKYKKYKLMLMMMIRTLFEIVLFHHHYHYYPFSQQNDDDDYEN